MDWKGKPCYDCRIGLDILLYFGTRHQRDIDNCFKLIFDGMQGIVYKNDSQIDELYAIRLLDKKNPRVIVTVFRLTSS